MPLEITRFQEIDRHLGVDRASTLLVLDVDQTILRCPHQWGGEPWYYYLIAENKRRGLSDKDAILAADHEWEESQRKIDLELMEIDTAKFIARWMSEGVIVVGLTARAPTIAARTHEQLALVGVTFSDVKLRRNATGPAHSVFERGVFFVGALEPKGMRFPQWYAALEATPARLVFVDDRHEHVTSMERWMHAQGIAGECLRYGASDSLKAAFDIKIVEEEKKRLS